MSARGAYCAARRAHSEPGPLPCHSCGVTHPPEALQRREDGTVRRECRPCANKRNAERMKRRRAALAAAAAEGTKVCSKCVQILPLLAFDRRSDSAGYRCECKKCRSQARAESKRRSRAAPKARPVDERLVPRTPGSALSDAGFGADLYAQALRALATSPPVPVWEREEWA